jgi:hypothetical protein
MFADVDADAARAEQSPPRAAIRRHQAGADVDAGERLASRRSAGVATIFHFFTGGDNMRHQFSRRAVACLASSRSPSYFATFPQRAAA